MIKKIFCWIGIVFLSIIIFSFIIQIVGILPSLGDMLYFEPGYSTGYIVGGGIIIWLSVLGIKKLWKVKG